MKKTTEALPLCPVCRKGHLHPTTRSRVFNPNGKSVEVSLQTSTCDACGEETTRAAQHRENLATLLGRRQHYGKLLMGEDILALRKRYGLKQQDASKIFGKGKIAFSRYENEATYPDESTTLLLRLAIERPDVIKSLADKAGVDLPLWGERCEDERRVKVQPLVKVYDTAQSGPKRQDRYVSSGGAAGFGSSVAVALSALLPTTRLTLTLPDASNDGQMERGSIAS